MNPYEHFPLKVDLSFPAHVVAKWSERTVSGLELDKKSKSELKIYRSQMYEILDECKHAVAEDRLRNPF